MELNITSTLKIYVVFKYLNITFKWLWNRTKDNPLSLCHIVSIVMIIYLTSNNLFKNLSLNK